MAWFSSQMFCNDLEKRIESLILKIFEFLLIEYSGLRKIFGKWKQEKVLFKKWKLKICNMEKQKRGVGQCLPLNSNNAVLYEISKYFKTSKFIQNSFIWI